MLFVGGVLLLCTLGGYFFKKNFRHRISDLEISVYPAVLQVGDTLHFVANTQRKTVQKWEFGDGNLSLIEKGYHLYKRPGFYQVTYTFMGQHTKTFSIEVKQDAKKDYGDYFTQIDAPSEAQQFENVIFKAVTEKASLFSWKFGETGNVDAKEPFVIYAYQEAGEYEVLLYTDETAYPVLHKITIYPSFKNLNKELDVEEGYKAIDTDFRDHLQQIANGASFNQHYNYLVNKYLCENENAVVRVNTTKGNSFYYYCMGLRFDRKASIQLVKVGFDEEAKCVTKINITQASN